MHLKWKIAFLIVELVWYFQYIKSLTRWNFMFDDHFISFVTIHNKNVAESFIYQSIEMAKKKRYSKVVFTSKVRLDVIRFSNKTIIVIVIWTIQQSAIFDKQQEQNKNNMFIFWYWWVHCFCNNLPICVGACICLLLYCVYRLNNK